MGYTFRFFLRREVSMPWMQSSVTEERLRFVARAPDGGGHHDVCRDFGVAQAVRTGATPLLDTFMADAPAQAPTRPSNVLLLNRDC
jgi:hypothetical protein